LAALLAGPAAHAWAKQPAAQTAPAAPAEAFRLNGFRSANFGMTQDQVRQAIRRDFNLSGDRVVASENGVERTQILTALVPDLLPGSGQTQVAYVFGFRSKQLVQVTVTFGGTVNPNLTQAAMIDFARLLLGYLTGAGYKADTVATNLAQPDGTLVVFRGDDAQGRRTILVLAGVAAPDGPKPAGPPVLQLSYIRDPQNPDVFQIRRGDF
jgi:hypothetical protein